MAVLHRINQELTESGEFVATQGLAEPKEAKVVRGEKNGVPVTDGIFPESKEFLLGYWIVDVPTAERAYAIAGRISAGRRSVRTCRLKCGSSQPMSSQIPINKCREIADGSD